jgi:CheY-like chemotaxis protein
MKKAVVIEDNKDSMRLITYALQHAGYEVIPAETGEEGVGLALRECPDFVIVDINLPGIDGLEATRQIRSSAAGTGLPIIAITSYAMAGDMERILASGCNGYFEKPIDPLTIVQRIEAVITSLGVCRT